MGDRSSSSKKLLFEATLTKYRNSIQQTPSAAVQKLFRRPDLLREIKDAQADQSSLANQWILDHKGWSKLAPLINALERFSASMDTFVQYNPSPASLIWGGVKLLLRVLSDYKSFVTQLLDMLEVVGQELWRLCNYLNIFPNDSRLHDPIYAAFTHVVSFLILANGVFSTNALKTFFQSLYKPLNSKVQQVVEAIRQNVRLADATFFFGAAQAQQGEQQQQILERSKQDAERVQANDSRTLIKHEFQQAEKERNLQAEERAKAQAERRRFAQQREAEADKSRDQHRHKIMKWLSRSDTVNAYLNALVKQSENPSSCKWILETIEYRTWVAIDDPTNALWIHSGPGTGKTVLAGHIVRTLRETSFDINIAVAFFFCDGNNAMKDDSLIVLRSLLCQLLDLLPDLPSEMDMLYRDSYLKGSESAQSLPFLELQDILSQTIDHFDFVYFVIDGIDEMVERTDLLRYLSALGRRGTQDRVKVLVVSRMEPDIRQTLGGFRQFSIKPSNTQNDIKAFILRSVRDKLALDQAETQKTVKLLLKRTRGMFIWVRLVIDLLSEAASDEEYREILHEIPLGLHEIYCVVIERVHRKAANGPSSRTSRVMLIFRWLALSPRPLKIQELQEALAIEGLIDSKASKGSSWEANLQRLRPTEQAIRDICGNLIDEENGFIRLLHHTAREFLLSSNGYRSPEVQRYTVYSNTGNARMSKACLTYIVNTDSSIQSVFAGIDDTSQRIDLRNSISSNHPFYEYACKQWTLHLGRCPVELNSEPLRDFSTFQLCTSWYQGWSLFHPTGRVPQAKLFQRLQKHGTALNAWLDLMNKMLAGFRTQSDVSLIEIAKYTADAPLLLNEKSEVSFVKAMDLRSASEFGHHSIVSQLLKVESPEYSTIKPAFNIAIQNKHVETISVLCEYLVTRDWAVQPIEIAQSKNDRAIVEVLWKRLRERAAEIDKFLGDNPSHKRHKRYGLPPDSDARDKLFDRPYWESITSVSDRNDHLLRRDFSLHEVSCQPFLGLGGKECPHIKRRKEVEKKEMDNESERELDFRHLHNPDGIVRPFERSKILEIVDPDHLGLPYAPEVLASRLRSYYLYVSSPAETYSGSLGPSFHFIKPSVCRPSKVFPGLTVSAEAVCERTWPTKTDCEGFRLFRLPRGRYGYRELPRVRRSFETRDRCDPGYFAS